MKQMKEGKNMANFTGQLRQNEIFGAIYNMIISQQVFADNIAGTKSTLVDMARVDGSLYGDQKLYYATDCLHSYAWGNDSEATNLLALHRPPAPKVQAVVLDIFRHIPLTLDDYLTKRAFSTEGTFSQFNSVMQGWIGDTKKVIDATTYNAFIGTATTSIGKQTVSVDLTTATQGLAGEEKARVRAGEIGKEVSRLLTNLTDTSRDYNDYGFLRSYNVDDLVFVWNSDYVSEIEKRDLPSTFHKDFLDKFAQHTLTARYFGTVNGTSVTKSNGTTIRSLIEQEVQDSGGTKYQLFAGDIIPENVTLVTDGSVTVPSYTVDSKVILKVYHKNSAPYMSAFEVGTSFFNPKSLTTNHYLTWGHNTLEYLKNYPFITVKEV